MVGVPGVAWRRYVELGLPVAAGVLAVYLFGRTLAPFLPALCWAFAVAVIVLAPGASVTAADQCA